MFLLQIERLQAFLQDPEINKINFSSFDELPLPLDPNIRVLGIYPERATLFKVWVIQYSRYGLFNIQGMGYSIFKVWVIRYSRYGLFNIQGMGHSVQHSMTISFRGQDNESFRIICVYCDIPDVLGRKHGQLLQTDWSWV